MSKKIIIGNWKMHKDEVSARRFMQELKKLIPLNKDKIGKNMRFGIAAPFITIGAVSQAKIRNFIVSAQNMHYESEGAFTGEISASMLKSVGANAVLIGHSERRSMFGETDKMVNKKVWAALRNGLLPVICVGETLDEFEQRQTQKVIKKQLEVALEDLSEEDKTKIVIAYEPVWAIGTGKSASAMMAETVCKQYIRPMVTKDTPILYGGSVKPENIAEFLSQPNIDGALVGGASLEVKSFLKLLTLNK